MSEKKPDPQAPKRERITWPGQPADEIKIRLEREKEVYAPKDSKTKRPQSGEDKE